MRAVRITLTQARRAPGSVCTMRRTISRSCSSNAGLAPWTSTAAIRMGLRLTCSVTEPLASASLPSAMNQRLSVFRRPARVMRVARRVSSTASGRCRSSTSCEAL